MTKPDRVILVSFKQNTDMTKPDKVIPDSFRAYTVMIEPEKGTLVSSSP